MKDEAPVTDCGDEGCGECEVCERMNFLEWVGQVAGGIPQSIERNNRVDRYIAATYPFPPVREGTSHE